MPDNLQPVLQMLECRKSNAGGPQQMRCRLSDGMFSYTGCLAGSHITERFVEDNLFDSKAIIRITEFTRNLVNE